MSQPPHKPTPKLRAEIEAYAAVGVPHHDIAKLVSMSTHTLLKYYDMELGVGKAKANAQVAKSLFRQAINGNIPASIFWLKSQAGWREVQVVEHIGKDNAQAIDFEILKSKLDAALIGRSSEKTSSSTVQ